LLSFGYSEEFLRHEPKTSDYETTEIFKILTNQRFIDWARYL
jgi:hypothetical protein